MKISKNDKYVSLVLKCITVIAAVWGIWLSATGGNSAFMGGRHVFMFFTIQSNIAIAVICLIGAVLLVWNLKVENWWYVLKFVGTVSITLTGMVFCFVLAPTLGAFAWQWNNVLTHVIVPIAAIVDFFVTGVYGSIKNEHVLLVTLPPLAYAVYAGIGYLAGWEFLEGIHYPYFFLNWGSPAGAFGFTNELPFMGCVWWILVLLLFLIGVGKLYLWILNQRKQRLQKTAADNKQVQF